MGLFDNANFDDPKTMGLLAAAANMLNASGPSTMPRSFGQVAASGLMGGLQTYGAAKKQALDQQKEAMQMDMLKQQIAQATRKNTLINNMLEQYGGGGTPAASNALSAGAAQGDIGPTVSNAARMAASPMNSSSSSINGIPREAIAHDLAFNDGKNVSEWLFKRGTPDMQVSNGYAYDRNRVPSGFLPQLNVSRDGQTSMVTIGPDGQPTISAPQGAVKTFADYQDAQERVKAQRDLLPLGYVGQDGRPIGGTRAGYIDKLAQPSPLPSSPRPATAPAGFPTISPQVQQGRDSEALKIIQAEYDAETNPENKAALQREITRLQGNVGGPPVLQSEAEKTQQIGGIKIKQGAQEDINKNWIATSYNPVIEAGRAASSLTASLDALNNIDVKTGWGAEGKAAGASLLTSLGIAPENAQMFATNAQRFQSVAMDRLLTVLQAQKGPQTEGDSSRAQQTFAQLKNTPMANQFIVDFARAKSNADARRAAFYADALPLAQAEGDLSKIDRKWKEIQGSIWADPILQKWVKK